MKHCTTCLVSNVYLSSLGESDVKLFLERILKSYGVDLENSQEFDICYECKALLLKSYTFIRKALKSQKILQELQCDKFQEDSWQDMRNKYNLGSNLCCLKLNAIDCNSSEILETEPHFNTKVLTCIEIDRDPKVEDSVNDNIDGLDIKSNETINQLSDFEFVFEPKIEIKIEESIDLGYNPLEYPEEDHMYNYVVTEHISTKPKRKCVKKNLGAKKPCYNRKGKKNAIKIENDKLNYEDNEMSNDSSDDDLMTRLLRRKALKAEMKKRKSGKRKPTSKSTHSKRIKVSDKDSDPNIVISSSEDEEGTPKRVYPRNCEGCDRLIETARQHYLHYVNEHPDLKYPYPTVRRFPCPQCNKAFDSQARLVDHANTHGEKTTLCVICGKRFANMSQLRNHHARVHNEVSLYCSYCNKGFKEKQALKLHVRIHTGEKPYRCQTCGASFAHGGNLTVHIRVNHPDVDPKSRKMPELP